MAGDREKALEAGCDDYDTKPVDFPRLLGKIVDEGLLTAIAGGTFGITRRPPDGGRGLDGVIRQADGYFNPATEILEADGPAEASAQAASPGKASTGKASTDEASTDEASTGEER